MVANCEEDAEPSTHVGLEAGQCVGDRPKVCHGPDTTSPSYSAGHSDPGLKLSSFGMILIIYVGSGYWHNFSFGNVSGSMRCRGGVDVALAWILATASCDTIPLHDPIALILSRIFICICLCLRQCPSRRQAPPFRRYPRLRRKLGHSSHPQPTPTLVPSHPRQPMAHPTTRTRTLILMPAQPSICTVFWRHWV